LVSGFAFMNNRRNKKKMIYRRARRGTAGRGVTGTGASAGSRGAVKPRKACSSQRAARFNFSRKVDERRINKLSLHN
jgi:hypothetical protein